MFVVKVSLEEEPLRRKFYLEDGLERQFIGDRGKPLHIHCSDCLVDISY